MPDQASPALEPEEPERGNRIGRIVAGAALIAAIVVIALVFFGPSDAYTVKARFVNAGQLVRGNYAQVGGTKAGTVTGFELTSDGQAEIELEVDDEYAPLREGTRAVIKQGSQSSTANRYVDLFLPPEDAAGDKIPDGGVIAADRTTSVVDLDQFFNLFDRRTRASLRGFLKGQNRAYAGRGKQANPGLAYLDPNLAQASRLFNELSYDPPVLERFLIDSSKFVTALAERRGDLSELVANLNSTTRALGNEKLALAEVVERLPGFMRTANTTYVNLRATLDDVDPLVDASKPVAKRLRVVLPELQRFARDARPTVRDLRRLLGRDGRNPGILQLNRTYRPLADSAVDTMDRRIDFGTGPVGVGKRRGSFPEAAEAFRDSAPIVGHGRPYTPDFLGWFDDFSQTGAYDALGSFSRSQTFFNAFSPQGVEIPLPMRGQTFKALANVDQFKRCPGASEEPAADGSNVFSGGERGELDCLEDHRATGDR